MSFFGSGLFETFIEYHWETRKISSIHEVWEDILEGFQFIRNSKSLLALTTLGILINTLLQPVISIILPYLSRVILGFSSVQFGSIQTVATIGALTGNLIIAGKLKESSENLLFKALFAQLICLFPLSLVIHPYFQKTAYFMLLGVFATFGLFNTLVNVPLATKLQKAVPNEVRARFFSAFETALMITIPLGMAIVGPLLDIVNVSTLIATLVVISLFVSVYYYTNFKEIIMRIGAEHKG
ncbi:MAG: hypothetical protein PWQ92_228 [Thermococcaceae archaeon]|nr:hypothetical protein [Thermococcaceae archaeon]